MRTTATRDGDGWVIRGAKQWITSGDIAGVFVVWARTGGAGTAGISCFLVEGGAPGLRVGRHEDKMGLRGSSTVSLQFDDVRVGVAVEGDPHVGLALDHLGREHLGVEGAAAVVDVAPVRGGVEDHDIGARLAQGRRGHLAGRAVRAVHRDAQARQGAGDVRRQRLGEGGQVGLVRRGQGREGGGRQVGEPVEAAWPDAKVGVLGADQAGVCAAGWDLRTPEQWPHDELLARVARR